MFTYASFLFFGGGGGLSARVPFDRAAAVQLCMRVCVAVCV